MGGGTGGDASLARFTSTLGRRADRYAFDTQTPGAVLLEIDARQGYRYEVSCQTKIDQPPFRTEHDCEGTFQCRYYQLFALTYVLNCEKDPPPTMTRRILAAAEMCSKLKGSGARNMFYQLDRAAWLDAQEAAGWRLDEPCPQSRFRCVDGKKKLVRNGTKCRAYQSAPLPGAFAKCTNVSYHPLAMIWDVELGSGAGGGAWKSLKSGIPPLEGEPYRTLAVAPHGAFVAEQKGPMRVKVNYRLNELTQAGYGKVRVIRPGRAEEVCPVSVWGRASVSQHAFQWTDPWTNEERPVAWSLDRCTVTERAPGQ